MKLRKILGNIVLVIALVSTTFFLWNGFWRIGTCTQMTANDMQIPHQDIEEYTQHSIMFDELCDPVYFYIWMVFDLAMWGVGWQLVKEKKVQKS